MNTMKELGRPECRRFLRNRWFRSALLKPHPPAPSPQRFRRNRRHSASPLTAIVFTALASPSRTGSPQPQDLAWTGNSCQLRWSGAFRIQALVRSACVAPAISEKSPTIRRSGPVVRGSAAASPPDKSPKPHRSRDGPTTPHSLAAAAACFCLARFGCFGCFGAGAGFSFGLVASICSAFQAS